MSANGLGFGSFATAVVPGSAMQSHETNPSQRAAGITHERAQMTIAKSGEIEQQEPEGRPASHRRHAHRRRPESGRESGGGQANQRRRSRQAVDAVDEVEGIDDRQRDKQGRGNGKNAEPQEAGSERVADIPEIQAAADHHDERGADLSHKPRRDPDIVTVFDDAHDDEERGGDQQSPSVRGLHGGHRRNEDADQHRDAADQRNLADVVLATAGLVREVKTKRNGTQRDRENHGYRKRQRARRQ